MAAVVLVVPMLVGMNDDLTGPPKGPKAHKPTTPTQDTKSQSAKGEDSN